jgi:hypothetical protein
VVDQKLVMEEQEQQQILMDHQQLLLVVVEVVLMALQAHLQVELEAEVPVEHQVVVVQQEQ